MLFFELGRQPEISTAELAHYIPRRLGTFKFISIRNNVAIAEASTDVQNPQKFIAGLGGCPKFGEIVYEAVNLKEFLLELENEEFVRKILNTVADHKIMFGFSFYGFKEDESFRFQKECGKILKKFLKSKFDLRSRFVVSKSPILSSVVVSKNNLISKGFEITVSKMADKIYISKTLAVQDFEEYNKRDYKRPEIDPKAGMLPPKLAQILLNLADLGSGARILDPFCGVGTILAEALLKDFKVAGSDISEQMVRKTEKNLKWLAGEYPKLPLKDRILGLFEADANEIQQKSQKLGLFDAIISESTLGPPLTRFAKKGQILRIKRDLEKQYLSVFENFRDVLKETGKIVITMPFFRFNNGQNPIYIENFNKILDLGYILEQAIPPETCREFNIVLNSRGTLLYFRPDQMVGREICIFKKIAKI